MQINRRQFNKFILSTSALTLIPNNLLATPYNGVINWGGITFLLPYDQIKDLTPIVEAASKLPSKSNSEISHFIYSINDSLVKKPVIKKLNVNQNAPDAKLALTLAFAGEFNFGKFVDAEENATAYLMRTYSHCILYNPLARIVVSSVPIRAKIANLVKNKDIKQEKMGTEVELMKSAFYNDNTPQNTIVEQFRIMLSKLSITNEWRGRAPRVTSVTFSKKKEHLFMQNFGLSKDVFIDFIGQATTSAFVYKLNNPIIPYNKTNAMESTSILSAFNNSTKLYEKLEIRFPKPETEIKIHYKGWKFKEKPLTPPMQQVTLIIGFKIQIIDEFAELINNRASVQNFSARKVYMENKDGTMRSDASEVAELTEGLLERAFKSIADRQYRERIMRGDIVKIGPGVSARFKQYTKKSDPDYIKKAHQQSDDVVSVLSGNTLDS